MRNILFCGFGRIGLTHYIISKALNVDSNYTIFEPNKIISRLLSTYLSNADIVTNLDQLNKQTFDYTLICSPTQFHISLVNRANVRRDSNIFVEKPFGCLTDINTEFATNIIIGYVLRYNPYVQWIRKNIDPKDVCKVVASYNSYTIKSKPKGWRAHYGGGVLNEMGSHLIDLLQYTHALDPNDINVCSSKMLGPVSGQDDIVKASIKSGQIDIDLELNWINKKLRKPYFKIEYILNDGTIVHLDAQSIDIERNGRITNLSVDNFITEIPYYLRGIDFTLQMKDFYGNKEHCCTPSEAIEVNKIINMIKQDAQ